jgi:uncharacterized repeat protein (TIGR03847 family)
VSRFELDPVDRLTAAAVGEPGQRSFYLQARKGDVVVSMLLEKQQVALLSAHIEELLERVGPPDEAGEPDIDSLDLEEPVVPEFRIGRIGLGFDEERDLVLLQCDEFVPEPEEGEEPVELDADPGQVRLWATRAQISALARRGEHEVESGRPVCSMCGQAIEAEGHFCPRSNGHQEVTRLV